MDPTNVIDLNNAVEEADRDELEEEFTRTQAVAAMMSTVVTGLRTGPIALKLLSGLLELAKSRTNTPNTDDLMVIAIKASDYKNIMAHVKSLMVYNVDSVREMKNTAEYAKQLTHPSLKSTILAALKQPEEPKPVTPANDEWNRKMSGIDDANLEVDDPEAADGSIDRNRQDWYDRWRHLD